MDDDFMTPINRLNHREVPLMFYRNNYQYLHYVLVSGFTDISILLYTICI